MSDRVATGWCALFHFAKGLDNVDLTIALQRTINEAVEPAQREFPGFLDMCPSNRGLAVARRQPIEPMTIVRAIWQACRQFVSFKA